MSEERRELEAMFADMYTRMMAEAEIRGFRRAAEFAAKLARARAEEISAKLLPVSAVNELHGWADVILATLEQTSEPGEKK